VISIVMLIGYTFGRTVLVNVEDCGVPAGVVKYSNSVRYILTAMDCKPLYNSTVGVNDVFVADYS